jgi:hypothetical protein
MDDAGDAAPAAAMGMMIVYINLVARLAGSLAGAHLGGRNLRRSVPLVELAAT